MRALCLVVVAACGVDTRDPTPTDEHGVPLPSAGTATLRDGTVILPASLTIDATTDLTNVVLPYDDSLLDLERGNIIVSGTGDGFVRRVYAVEPEGDRIRIVTSPATLADAVESATFALTTTEPLVVPAHIDGRTPLLEATIDGDLDVTPTVALSFALTRDGVQTFDLRVTGAATSNVRGTVDFTADTHWAWGEERSYEATVFRRAFALGPLPLVVVARMTTSLAASAYVEMPVAFTAGAHARIGLDASTTYAPSTGWTMTDSSTVDITPVGPLHAGAGRASLSVGIVPKLELAFYGASGPTLQLVTQAGGFGAFCGDALLTGLQAAAQGAVAFDLGSLAQLARTDVTLYDERPFLDELETCATP